MASSADAKQLMKEAEDCLASGWFSSPDHLAAAGLFEKAGRQYVLKNKDGVAAMGAYLKAAKSHLSKGGRGSEAAAVAYEEAGKANPAMAAQLYKSAVELLLANGNIERAIEVCHRSADAMDKDSSSGAVEHALGFSVQIGELGAKTSSVNTRLIDASLGAFKRLVKFRRIPEAISVGTQLLGFYQALALDISVRKMILSLMVLHVVRGDVVKAKLEVQDALQKNVGDFARSAEGDAAQDFIQAYEQLNAEAVKRMVAKPPFTSLEYAVTMLAQELTPGERVAAATTAKPATAVPAVAAAAAEDDDFPDLS